MKTARSTSLRTRLLAGTLAAVTAIWVVLSLVAWREARKEADELFDAHLAQTTTLIAGFVGHDAEEIAEHLPAHRYARKVAFQVWGRGTRLVTHSAGAPRERLSAVDQGFSDSTSGGRRWRVYSQWDERRRYLIQVAETLDARRAIGRELASHLLAPLGIALPLLALALVLLIRASLAPLSRLADSIGSRSPERLDPIGVDQAPRELHPIVRQLNRLFARVALSIEQERRFTADAAHELRTPLAAMRTHAQVARASRDGAERDLALDRVVESVDRATHLVEQLLTLARLDAAGIAGGFVRCDLREIAAEAVAQVVPMALAKSTDLALTGSGPAAVTGDPTLLTVMLRNLIDNAVRYSPATTRVTVTVGANREAAAWFEVVDQGAGIAAEERDRVFDRFYRISGTGGSGSGLGLAIVARIAEIHGALLTVADGPAGAGLSVRLTFPSTGAA